jgi:hypothetical protein
MKKPSYEELKLRVAVLEKKHDLLCFYLYDQGINSKFCRPTLVLSDDGKYTAELFRQTSASGGYVVIRNLQDGNVPTIEYLDNIDAKWPPEFRILADRLRVIRQRIMDEEAQKAAS